MNQRAQEIFRLVVDSYMSTGEPVGSRTLSKILNKPLSPATIRDVMSDLERLGFLYSPHTSAGRMPTEKGLRLFVDAFMEVGDLNDDERRSIETLGTYNTPDLDRLFENASQLVSGMSSCAAVVASHNRDRAVQQIQFVPIDENRTLAVLVFTDKTVENRILNLPSDMPPSSLTSAANYLNTRLSGRTLGQARKLILEEIAANRTELDSMSTKIVEQGLAVTDETSGQLFVRGRANLLEDVALREDFTGIQHLIDTLDQQETMVELLKAAEEGEGVRIFIGSENRLFKHAGLSMVVAPARNQNQQVVGAVGVIGPTRLNYGRIVPIVDYTSQFLARMVG